PTQHGAACPCAAARGLLKGRADADKELAHSFAHDCAHFSPRGLARRWRIGKRSRIGDDLTLVGRSLFECAAFFLDALRLEGWGHKLPRKCEGNVVAAQG